MKTRTKVLTALTVWGLVIFYRDLKKAERQGERNPFIALWDSIKSTFRENTPLIGIKKVADSFVCAAQKIRRDARAKRAFERIPRVKNRWGEVKYLCDAIDAGEEMYSHKMESPQDFDQWFQKQLEETLSQIKHEDYQTKCREYHETVFGQLQMNGYAAEREWAHAVDRDPVQTERFLGVWAEYSTAMFEAVTEKLHR
jgi:hypothetical protein